MSHSPDNIHQHRHIPPNCKELQAILFGPTYSWRPPIAKLPNNCRVSLGSRIPFAIVEWPSPLDSHFGNTRPRCRSGNSKCVQASPYWPNLVQMWHVPNDPRSIRPNFVHQSPRQRFLVECLDNIHPESEHLGTKQREGATKGKGICGTWTCWEM